MSADLLDKIVNEGMELQDRANLYAVILGHLKHRVGSEAFNEDVQGAVAFLKDRKNTEVTTNDQYR